eukprot:g784.t1
MVYRFKRLRPQALCYRRQLSTHAAASVQSSQWSGLRSTLTSSRSDLEDARTPSNVLVDSFGRHHDYLRISLTERCNLRCRYCMPPNGVKLSPSSNLLSDDEILRLANLLVSEGGISKIRLTGGEPLLRPSIFKLCHDLNALRSYGLTKLGITTNGIKLTEPNIHSLYQAGVDTLNISLDSLHPNRFSHMTRRSPKLLAKILIAIETAHRIGFDNPDRLKVNVVALKDMNDAELCDFINIAKALPVEVRFIEFMPFNSNGWGGGGAFISYQEMLRKIETEQDMKANAITLDDDNNSIPYLNEETQSDNDSKFHIDSKFHNETPFELFRHQFDSTEKDPIAKLFSIHPHRSLKKRNEKAPLEKDCSTHEEGCSTHEEDYSTHEEDYSTHEDQKPAVNAIDRLQTIENKETIEGIETTANDYDNRFPGRVGFITSMTQNFCSGCSRIRLTADGHLKTCLFGSEELDLRPLLRNQKCKDEIINDNLLHAIGEALQKKHFKYGGASSVTELESLSSENRSMIRIGVGNPNHKCNARSKQLGPHQKLGQKEQQVGQLRGMTKRFSNGMTRRFSNGRIRRFSTISHISNDSNTAQMVDVSHKENTTRTALASATVHLPEETIRALEDHNRDMKNQDDSDDLMSTKGPVLHTARIAGVMAVKKTADIIPLCHPLPLHSITIDFERPQPNEIKVFCCVKTSGKTGVEMEAMLGVSATSLCIYDMLKATSKAITVTDIMLLEKSGGKSGKYISQGVKDRVSQAGKKRFFYLKIKGLRFKKSFFK